jgi:hypothetical protein
VLLLPLCLPRQFELYSIIQQENYVTCTAASPLCNELLPLLASGAPFLVCAAQLHYTDNLVEQLKYDVAAVSEGKRSAIHLIRGALLAASAASPTHSSENTLKC